ncbi:MAG TPA: hypothetical protein VEG62_02105, partial [Acidimicrobiales bacterium]|nr:hypothetical protein [Acidimicrobiales bacterium]
MNGEDLPPISPHDPPGWRVEGAWAAQPSQPPPTPADDEGADGPGLAGGWPVADGPGLAGGWPAADDPGLAGGWPAADGPGLAGGWPAADDLPAPGPARRHPAAIIGVTIAVVLVLVAGVVGVAALTGPAGNTPEDAVRGLLTAAGNGDVLGALDHIDPAE